MSLQRVRRIALCLTPAVIAFGFAAGFFYERHSLHPWWRNASVEEAGPGGGGPAPLGRTQLWTILRNNTKVLTSVLLGAVTLGLLGYFILFVNGIQLGAIAAGLSTIQPTHYPAWLRVAAHGAPEYLGFGLGQVYVIYLLAHLLEQSLKGHWTFKAWMIWMPLAAYGLIALAATIEVYVSPRL